MEKLWLNLCVNEHTYGNHGMGPIQALYIHIPYGQPHCELLTVQARQPAGSDLG